MQQGNVAQPRNSCYHSVQRTLNQASQEIYFSFLQTEVILNGALTESRLTDPAHGEDAPGRKSQFWRERQPLRGEQVRGQLQVTPTS